MGLDTSIFKIKAVHKSRPSLKLLKRVKRYFSRVLNWDSKSEHLTILHAYYTLRVDQYSWYIFRILCWAGSYLLTISAFNANRICSGVWSCSSISSMAFDVILISSQNLWGKKTLFNQGNWANIHKFLFCILNKISWQCSDLQRIRSVLVTVSKYSIRTDWSDYWSILLRSYKCELIAGKYIYQQHEQKMNKS